MTPSNYEIGNTNMQIQICKFIFYPFAGSPDRRTANVKKFVTENFAYY